MARTQNIRAGKAVMQMVLDKSGLKRGLAEAEYQMKQYGRRIGALGRQVAMAGGLMAAPLAAATGLFGQMGSRLGKVADRTGTTAEALSELQAAAVAMGATSDRVNEGLAEMVQRIGEAAEGEGEAAEAMRRLNLDAERFLSMDPAQAFERISDAIKRLPSRGEQLFAIDQIFGGSEGRELSNLILQGADGIRELREEARKMGQTMSSREVASAEDLMKNLRGMARSAKMAAAEVGQALAPVVSDLGEKIQQAAGPFRTFIENNQSLVKTAGMVAVGAIGAGGALMTLGAAAWGVGSAIGAVSTILSGAVTIIGGLLTPVGALTAAVAGLGGYLLWTSDAAGNAFSFIEDVGLKSLRSIQDALMAGEWKAAADVAWGAIKYAFQAGTQDLEEMWNSVMHGLTQTWFEFTRNLAIGWARASAALQQAFETFTNKLTRGLIKAGGALDIISDVEGTLQAAEQMHQSRVSNIEREKGVAIRAAEEQYRQRKKLLDDMHRSELKAIREETEEAKSRWEEARRKAAQAAKEAGDRGRARAPGLPSQGDLGRFNRALSHATSTRGTFNAMVAGGMGVGTVGELQRQTRKLEDIDRRLEDIEDEQRHGAQAWTTGE